MARHGRHEEVQFVDSNGQTRTLDMRVCPVLCDSAAASILILANDVTQQRILQSQLDQAQRLESVGQLAAGVAHEINTPMQYIGDNVRYVAKSIERLQQLLDVLPSLIDEEVTDEQLLEMRRSLTSPLKPRKIRSTLEQIPEALSDSIQGAEAVAKIVSAMKEFSHPGGDDMSLVGLNHILESTITVARSEWKYVADVVTQFDESLPDIPALQSELNQAFLNIIVNAAHAIGDRVAAGKFEKGKITICTRSDGRFACVSIRDTGGGIPEHVRKRVFEPFFTTKEVGKGTGQGLAIAHSVIAQKHGGKLTFDVEEGQGTTFEIRIPLQLSCDNDNSKQEFTPAMEDAI
ncbi:ATP-binding protein [Stieleria varia]